jgi:ABC-type bacteriocin/lantibiotic exporter with double-glycine peptidase domain
VYVALKALDLPVGEFKDLESKLAQPSQMGFSMQQLAEAASSFGAHTLGVETSLDHLERRPGRFVCVALLEKKGHYVCIYDVDESSVFLVDPPDRRTVSRDAFAKLWSGKALLISDRPLETSLPRLFPARAVFAALGVAAVGVTLMLHVVRLRRSR